MRRVKKVVRLRPAPVVPPPKDVFGTDVPLWELGQHGGRTRPMNRDAAFENACVVSEVFAGLGIKHCLSHGTCLGVVRDGDSIAWDDDIDLAIFSEDRPKFDEARKQLRSQGFFVPVEGDPSKPIEAFGPLPNMPYYDLVAIRNGEKVECWIFDLAGDYYVYDPVRSGLAIPRRFLDTLGTTSWRGTSFNAPADVEGYLSLMYDSPTSNWRTPDPKKKYNDLKAE